MTISNLILSSLEKYKSHTQLLMAKHSALAQSSACKNKLRNYDFWSICTTLALNAYSVYAMFTNSKSILLKHKLIWLVFLNGTISMTNIFVLRPYFYTEWVDRYRTPILEFYLTENDQAFKLITST